MFKWTAEKKYKQVIIACAIVVLCLWAFLFYYSPYNLSYMVASDQNKLIMDGPIKIIAVTSRNSKQAFAILKQQTTVSLIIFSINLGCFITLMGVREKKANLQWLLCALFFINAILGFVFYLIFVTPTKGYLIHKGFSTSIAAVPLVSWMLIQAFSYGYEKLMKKPVVMRAGYVITFIFIGMVLIDLLKKMIL